ncbi:MAG: DUF3859 domain-containing protein [Thermoanaerobaculia bacterium]
MNSRAVLIVLLLATHGVPSCAPRREAPPTVRLIEYGIIRPVGPFVRHPDPNSAAGFTSSGPGNSIFEQRTTEVPATLGSAFGIRYRIENIPPGQEITVEEIIRHPPITKPTGEIVSEERTRDKVASQSGYIDQKFFYRLGLPYEVVPGDWSLTVAVNGSTAINQHFTVRPPK